MTVIDMSQWQKDHDLGEAGLTCKCGSAWFELVDGAVTLNSERSITGYAGTLRCIECGRTE